MSDLVQDMATARTLDGTALRRCLGRLQAAEAPWLHREVARRMAERLAILKPPPRVLIDWWAGLGGSADALRQACPRARRLAVEPESTHGIGPGPAAAWWSPRRWSGRRDPVCLESELVPESAQLLWANMVLHGAKDPQALMRQWLRALSIDGFLMFSTLGPGSLRGLRELYRAQGWPSPHAAFVDMHDLGDMLVHCGFADPVMDQETLTLTWPSPASMLAELRGLGGNVDPARFAGLRTPRWRQALERALLAGADEGGRIALEFEIVYGHALRPPPRATLAASTSIDLEDMRKLMRARPRR